MTSAIFTICSKNYLGQARTLMASVREYEPNAVRYIVVVDRKSDLPSMKDELATIVWVQDLQISDFEYKAFIFDVLELNTNVKPTALARLLRIHDKCVYMDPDTVLFAPLKTVWDALANANVALTPHTLVPMEGLQYPWEQDLLRYGGFNLGFIAIAASPESFRMLRWWEGRCLTSGFQAPADGFFVDQKFMDLAPIYFEGVVVLKDVGLNVAYWNLHERQLRQENGRWLIAESPLVFFHFSGFIYEPKGQEQLDVTKYPCSVSLRNRSELTPLIEDYRQRLSDNDHGKLRKISYGFSQFDDGVPIPKLARRLVAVCSISGGVNRPFSTEGSIYRELKRSGVLPRRGPITAGAKSRNLANLRSAQRVLGWCFRLLGVARYEMLLKFFGHVSSTFNQGFLLRDR